MSPFEGLTRRNMAAKSVYKSCKCGQCKNAPSKIRGEHKREAHRKFRRESKKSLREGEEDTPIISTGYVS